MYGLACLLSVSMVSCRVVVPYSLRPGLSSATTGLPLYPAERISLEQVDATLLLASHDGISVVNPAPFPDYKVLKFKTGLRLCRDTFHLSALEAADSHKPRIPTGPGTCPLAFNKLSMDEVEITNLDWRLFVSDFLPEGESVAKLLPDTAALPVRDYYTNPFYSFYPVVGVSYEQAKLFCEWRTVTVAALLKHEHIAAAMVYRLPTEAEWEEAAVVRSGLPFGTSCTELPVRVAEDAAAYLQKKSGSATPIAQIKKDIAAYNRQHPQRSWIEYAQPGPYFLHSSTPSYVYQGPKNEFGLYQMLGNVAELVAERGITKGGSYRDGITACHIKARGRADGPLPTVGFRTVCELKR